jgi:hypothetical protein
LRQYLTEKFRDIPSFKSQYGLFLGPGILDELFWLDIKTLEGFDNIIPKDFKERYMKIAKPRRGTTLTRLVRDILNVHNSEDYFNRAWQNRYYEFDSHDYLVFKEFGINTEQFPKQIEFDCRGL